MKEKLIANMQAQYHLSKEFTAYLYQVSRIETLKKGRLLQRIGDASEHIWFLGHGYLKSRYFDQSGKQHVTRFWKENEFILVKDSFNNKSPASDEIISMEKVTALSVDYQQVQHVLTTYPESNRLGRWLHVTDERSSRLRLNLLTLPTDEAYRQFCEKFKNFPLNRLLQQDIAAYLNCSPHTISMIRRKK